jgi:hypothetical protein
MPVQMSASVRGCPCAKSCHSTLSAIHPTDFIDTVILNGSCIVEVHTEEHFRYVLGFNLAVTK